MTKSLTSQNTISELLRRVPAFAKARSVDSSFMSYEDDSPYLVFGDFGLFLLKHLRDRQPDLGDENFLREAFGLVDEMLTSSDPELINLAQVGVMEVLADSPQALRIAQGYLSQRAKVELERLMP